MIINITLIHLIQYMCFYILILVDIITDNKESKKILEGINNEQIYRFIYKYNKDTIDF